MDILGLLNPAVPFVLAQGALIVVYGIVADFDCTLAISAAFDATLPAVVSAFDATLPLTAATDSTV